MNKLMDILSNPSKRMPMETLLKCETVLEKMILDTSMTSGSASAGTAHSGPLQMSSRTLSGGGQVQSETTGEQQSGAGVASSVGVPGSSPGINPLLDASIKLINTVQQHQLKSRQASQGATVSSGGATACLQLNHTMQRTFGASMDALLGSDITLPRLPKMRQISGSSPRSYGEASSDNDATTASHVPDVVRKEIAMLSSRFKVSLDPAQPRSLLEGAELPGYGLRVVCRLEDPNLPSVPPINVTIPKGYPLEASPVFKNASCTISSRPEGPDDDLQGYDLTPFLTKVKSAFLARMAHMSKHHTLTQLLGAWEMSVRAACSPNFSVAKALGTATLGMVPSSWSAL